MNVLRRPLPIREHFPALKRPCGNIDGVTELDHPPYIVVEAGWWDGEQDSFCLMLCRGDGWRACWYDGNPIDLVNDDSRWIYADGTNVPEEWRLPIAAAIAEVRERYTWKRIMFR